jgi:hypothetical protein
MRSLLLRKSLILLIILTPLVLDMGCKKQKRCGCGKDVIFEIIDGSAQVYYIESSKTAYFYATNSAGSTYWFCNPGKWIDFLKAYPQGQTLLVTGKVYYECQYLMNSGNYGYGYMPPTYQVDITSLKEDNYSKK